MIERVKRTFVDTTDLDLAHQEIGYLKDLCDAKDNVIAYQKELLNIQSESIKRFRLIEDELTELKKGLKEKEIKDEKPQEPKRTSKRISKTIQNNN